MVAGPAALPRLKTFIIEFRSASPRPDRIVPHPITRTVIPALILFHFKGTSEYLEDLISRIDGPQLNWIDIHYLNQLVEFQVAQLHKFIDRSLGPKLTLFRHAYVNFYGDRVTFNTSRHANYLLPDPSSPATITILCEGTDWQVSHIAQVISHFSLTLFSVVHLKLNTEDYQSSSTSAEWVYLLRSSCTVRTLHVPWILAGQFSLALTAIPDEMVAEVLTSFDLIYLGVKPVRIVEKFIASLRLSDRPVIVLDTLKEFEERLESYVNK